MSLFKFKQRLQYKCFRNNIGYTEVDEAYTSKTCTGCSYFNKNLGQFFYEKLMYKVH
jgi:transposase